MHLMQSSHPFGLVWFGLAGGGGAKGFPPISLLSLGNKHKPGVTRQLKSENPIPLTSTVKDEEDWFGLGMGLREKGFSIGWRKQIGV